MAEIPVGGDEDGRVSLENVSPYLRGSDGTKFDPVAVTRLGGTLPWDTQRDQTLCGESIVDDSGDMNVRMVMEGVMTASDLADLFALRFNNDAVDLNWAGRSATGIKNVTFDQLKFDRTDEDDVVDVDDNTEPLYSFQLQSKETEEGSS
jgi:hypothetical protein